MSEVRQYLIQQGVAAMRLHGQAFGDTSPLHEQASLENNFFDRRVTLRLQGGMGEMTASH